MNLIFGLYGEGNLMLVNWSEKRFFEMEPLKPSSKYM